jgi:hypothetical protein
MLILRGLEAVQACAEKKSGSGKIVVVAKPDFMQ